MEAVASSKAARQQVEVPFFPCAQVRWDDSPRFEEFAAIAINRSPDQFERLVRAARHTVAGDKHEKLIYIAAWNEWTEDHVLLPDTTWGLQLSGGVAASGERLTREVTSVTRMGDVRH